MSAEELWQAVILDAKVYYPKSESKYRPLYGSLSRACF